MFYSFRIMQTSLTLETNMTFRMGSTSKVKFTWQFLPFKKSSLLLLLQLSCGYNLVVIGGGWGWFIDITS